MIKKGIDVSAHQGNINWAQASTQISAVIIRAGYGKNNIDQKWVPNIEAASAFGLDLGAYWFSYAYSVDMAYMEGKYAALAVQKKLGNRKIPIAYDLEYDSVSYAAKKGVTIDRTAATQYAIAFLKAVKEAGYRPMIYTNMDYIRRYFDLAAIQQAVPDTMLWLAAWRSSRPNDIYGDMASVWQYTSDGSVAGITGRVDMDEIYDDLESSGPSADPEPVAPVQPRNAQMRVTASVLNIRKEPSAAAEDLGDLPAGTILTVDQIQDGWAHFEGWCSAKYLK